MPLYKTSPEPSGRMGLLWTLGTIKNGAILEFGSMGHMLYAKRWMSQTGIYNQSKLFTTHLDEKDISLGLMRRFEKALKEIAEDKSIQAVFVLPSSVPEMIGIDLEAICDEMQEELGELPIIPLGCGNFKAAKNQGIEEGLLSLVKAVSRGKIKSFTRENKEYNMAENAGEELVLQKCGKKLRYNLIGSVCDMSRFLSDAREVKRILNSAFSMEEICIMTADTSISSLGRMPLADINIVLRREGIKAAKEMEKSFGIPYLYGAPYGYAGTLEWIYSIEELTKEKADKDFLEQEMKEGEYTLDACKAQVRMRKNKAKIWLEGHEDVVKGISDFAHKEIGFRLEEGGILMAKERELKLKNASFTIPIERGLASDIFNIYESPFMGFRGAMKLCSLWLSYLME